MPGDQPATEETPSAEVLKDRIDTLHEQTNLGAGNDEPDPATAEDPPSNLKEGDKERNPD